ncbi:MAG: hypothetical protein AAFQ14_09230 [Cyanobacteria bacterium J06621_12]
MIRLFWTQNLHQQFLNYESNYEFELNTPLLRAIYLGEFQPRKSPFFTKAIAHKQ